VPPTALYAIQRFNTSTISIALTRPFLSFSKIMRRLFVEIAIIAAVIFFGWNTPFKDWTAQAYAKINSTFDSMGGKLQKHQDASVKRY
jgi:hypothetical protein